MNLARFLLGACVGCFACQWVALFWPIGPLLLSLGFGFAATWFSAEAKHAARASRSGRPKSANPTP